MTTDKAFTSILDNPPSLGSALTHAEFLSARAALVGFEYPDIWMALKDVKDEITELEEAIHAGDFKHAMSEAGDVLFSIVNVCRFLQANPEKALEGSNTRFERRFRHVEQAAHALGRPISDMSLDEMNALWRSAKKDVG